MNIQKLTLMELCNNNCFTDSEEDESDDDKEEYIINTQPTDTKLDTKTNAKNEKITIVVDRFYNNNKSEEKYDDWENIEFAELDEVINDPSSNLFTNKKKI